jgi:DNA modification methylase
MATTQQIIPGDCIEGMRTLPDASVHCCVTSPPYWGLRDYGHDGQIGLESTPEAYVARMVEVFREVRRILRDDAVLFLNLGDSYASGKQLVGIPWRVAFALQADGWRLRQDIIWHKPNPMPESVTDRCTKAHEYVFLLAKSERYFYDAEAVREPCNCKGRKCYRRECPGKAAKTMY